MKFKTREEVLAVALPARFIRKDEDGDVQELMEAWSREGDTFHGRGIYYPEKPFGDPPRHLRINHIQPSSMTVDRLIETGWEVGSEMLGKSLGRRRPDMDGLPVVTLKCEHEGCEETIMLDVADQVPSKWRCKEHRVPEHRLVEVTGLATQSVVDDNFKRHRSIFQLRIHMDHDLDKLPQDDRDRQLGAAIRELWERQDAKTDEKGESNVNTE